MGWEDVVGTEEVVTSQMWILNHWTTREVLTVSVFPGTSRFPKIAGVAHCCPDELSGVLGENILPQPLKQQLEDQL